MLVNGVNLACGEDSDCINRLTSIECSNEKCLCGENCQNQRFQNNQYADIDVIRTEKKGYGMRANTNISQGSFVYEYIGEVISEAKFRNRAKNYEKAGFKHFYFMMLQQGEFIDATAKGCLARFCNHSCNPNCYVDKWVVGDKLKMGIFTKRDVQAGEELTFDYNVDRYGSEAQPCYCGEANCVGVLGGKTQTEAVSRLPQLLVEALELDADDEYQWMVATKKTRKKKAAGESLDEDYSLSLPTKPITISSVSKVMSSLLQSREEWLIFKLIDRISSTTDNAIHARVMQMHGYQIFSQLLRDWKSNQKISVQILEILNKWPRLTKNKISSSKIESTVQELSTESQFDDVRELSKTLLTEWSNLQMAYRIPRRERVKAEEATPTANTPSDNSATESKAATPADGRNATKGKADGKQNGKKSNRENSNDEGKGRNKNSKQARNSLEGVPTGPANSKRKSFGTGSNANSSSHKNASNSESKKGLPPGWDVAKAPNGREYYYNRQKNITQWQRPVENDNNAQAPQKPAGGLSDDAAKAASAAAAAAVSLNPDLLNRPANQALSLQKIIEEATRQQEEQRRLEQQQETEKEERRLKHEQRKREARKKEERKKEEQRKKEGKQERSKSSGSDSKSRPSSKSESSKSSQGKEDKTRRILTATFAKYIPKIVVRYESQIGHAEVKRHSKDITAILVKKEMRSAEHVAKPDELSNELKHKIKSFVKMYMEKVISHKEKKAGQSKSPSADMATQSQKRELEDAGEQGVAKKVNNGTRLPSASPDGEINFDD